MVALDKKDVDSVDSVEVKDDLTSDDYLHKVDRLRLLTPKLAFAGKDGLIVFGLLHALLRFLIL